jgi:hypothetical protein
MDVRMDEVSVFQLRRTVKTQDIPWFMISACLTCDVGRTYIFAADDVFYNEGCYCNPEVEPVMSSWEKLADEFNSVSPDVRKAMWLRFVEVLPINRFIKRISAANDNLQTAS